MKAHYDVYEAIDGRVLVSCEYDGVPHRLPSNWCLVGGLSVSVLGEYVGITFDEPARLHHGEVYERWLCWADNLYYDNAPTYEYYICGARYPTEPAYPATNIDRGVHGTYK